MSRRPALFPQVTSINLFEGVARALTQVRRTRAKKVSSNRLTDLADPLRGLFTDGAHLLRARF